MSPWRWRWWACRIAPPTSRARCPAGDLDRATADEILILLTELNRQQKKTIVMVTHDPRAAEYAARHVDVDKGDLIVRRAAA